MQQLIPSSLPAHRIHSTMIRAESRWSQVEQLTKHFEIPQSGAGLSTM
jgi:hypothetical protein